MGQFIDEQAGPRGRFLDAEPTDTRSPVTRLYQDYLARPLTKALAADIEPTLRRATSPLVDLTRILNGGESFGQVARNDTMSLERDRPAAMPAAESLGELVVPQTPLMAGAQIATMGAGPAARYAGVPAIAALAKAHPALTRIFGGAVGGEVGNTLEGGTPGKGALVGGGTTALGEGLGAGAGRARLAIPGGKRAANEADAARIGGAVGEIVPELQGLKTVGDIRAASEGAGRAALGQAKEGTTRAIEQALPGRPGGLGPGEIPTPGPLRGQTTYGPQTSPTAAEPIPEPYGTSTRLGAEPVPPLPVYPAGGQVPRAATGATDTSMPLRQANDALTSIGEGAFNQNILDRTAKKAADRRLYGEVARDIEGGIGSAAGAEGPAAAGAHVGTQNAYAQGTKMLELFKRSGVVTNDGFLNVPKIQMALNNPRVAAQLKGALGEDGFATFVDAVTRGAGRGEVDRMTPGMGGPLDALMQVLRGQNTGAAQYARIPIATLLPNLGSKYVGRNPLALPESLRTILDVGVQKGVDEARR